MLYNNGRRKEKIVCCPAFNFPERRSSAPRLRSSASRGRMRSVSAPCTLTHGVLNALSVFAPESDYKTRCVIFRILIILRRRMRQISCGVCRR